MHLQNGEIQGDGHKGLLTAGEQRQGLQLLSRGLGLNFNAAAENIVLVLQLQGGPAAAEQLQEGLLEALLEYLKLGGEDLRHLLGDLLDDAHQLLLGPLHIVALIGEVGIAGVHPVKLLNGADVDGPQALDLPVQLADTPGGLGHTLQLDAQALGIAVAQLVPFPQLIQNLLFLQSAAV